MIFNQDYIQKFYDNLPNKLSKIRSILGKKPLTLTEKILYTHLFDLPDFKAAFQRGDSYVEFAPDRVAMQDATAQMALLQFMQAGKAQTAVPSSIHCDHLVLAKDGAEKDLANAQTENREIYDFLASVADKYNIDFWQAGSGIIHQIVFENYAFPGAMMVGTDSHTPTAGGLGMLAIGVGGADAVDVMVGMPWELKFPKIIGVHLKGKLNAWASPKDVILKLAGQLTVKGGTGYVVEYFGEGAASISATGKSTICNMGAEIGATSSVFPLDQKMLDYLMVTNRSQVAKLAQAAQANLMADEQVYANPVLYYDQVLELDLTTLEPYINGPATPDRAFPISEFAKAVTDNDFPKKMAAGLIGSCTNSSYEDLSRAASLIKQAQNHNLSIKTPLYISPGSTKIYETIQREGILKPFEEIGSTIFANACGPCIGQWSRVGAEKGEKNSIITSFNRNFAKRNDGNLNTYAFIASPEIITAMAIAGSMQFNPLTDSLTNADGKQIKFNPPQGDELPRNNFTIDCTGYVAPTGKTQEIVINPVSKRLQALQKFMAWDQKNLQNLCLLIKVKGKCTTDHISMAGPWLKYRGHLDNISNNLLINALNAFNEQTNQVKNQLTNNYDTVPQNARDYQQNGFGSVIVGEENYGEGSSREHAAMEPRHLGVKAVIVKSFARIHESNLKKQGILALTFANKSDYDKIKEDDRFDLPDLTELAPGKQLQLLIRHNDNSTETILLNQTYNPTQIEWFKAGSALNTLGLL